MKSINSFEKKTLKEGTILSLIKGVLAGFKDRDGKIGDFKAYITSDMLIGARISIFVTFETIIRTNISGLYKNMKISPADIEIIGQ